MSISWLDSGCDGPDIDVPAGGKLVHRHAPFAVGIRRVAARDDQVAGAEMRRHFVEHDFVQIFFLLIGPRRQFPFRDVRIDEHRGVGETFAVVLRVQRAEADRHFAFHHRFVFQDRDAAKIAVECLVVDRGLHFLEVQHRRGRLKFAAGHNPFAARIDIHAVRRFADRDEIQNAGDLRRIDDRHAIHHRRFAVGDRFLGGAPVHDRAEIAIFLRRVHFESVVRHLGVVARPERPAAARAFAGRAEIPIEWRRQNLPADVHLAASADRL